MTHDACTGGDPDMIDCDEVLERLYEFLDGELTPDREHEVRHHLEKCGPCLQVREFEEAYVRFLEARARAECAPDHLRKRILEHLLFEPGTPETP